MAGKYYFDTAIWRDYYENRNDRFRPLGDWAFELVKKIANENKTILYSELVVDELITDFRKEEIYKILDAGKGFLKKVDFDKAQFKEAVSLAKSKKIPVGDALHAVMARDNGAVMVTRDKHFDEIQEIVKSYKPEDLI